LQCDIINTMRRRCYHQIQTRGLFCYWKATEGIFTRTGTRVEKNGNDIVTWRLFKTNAAS
jgi:hypothetical protein